MFLSDVNVRARGLQTHLLSPSDLGQLAGAPGSAFLGEQRAVLGFLVHGVTAPQLELSVRRRAADDMAVLARWSQDRRSTLSVIFEDEDRRSIGALLRGAEQGVASEARLNGLVPTDALPERALETLAQQPTIKDVVASLVWWRHPLARALVAPAAGKHPSLFELEVALHRAFADRALGRAKKGGRHLTAHVRQLIDLANAWTALLHGLEKDVIVAKRSFVEGGARIGLEAFSKMLTLDSHAEVVAALAVLFRGSPLAKVFAAEGQDLSKLEAHVLQAQIDEQRRYARLDPSGPAVLLLFTLALRAQVLNLRRIIWGVALGAPKTLIQSELVAA